MKRIYVVLLFVLIIAMATEAQKTEKKSKKSKTSKSTTDKPGSTAAATESAPSGIPSESVKLAEEMVALAKRLLKAVKAGEKPAPLCPNGMPKVTCPRSPCSAWECRNILGTQCQAECHTCVPKFLLQGRDVTDLCDKRQASQSPSAATQTSVSTRTSVPSPAFPQLSDGFPSLFFPGFGESGPTMPMNVGGPASQFDMMANLENIPPGLSPTDFFRHLQQMQQSENQGSGSSSQQP